METIDLFQEQIEEQEKEDWYGEGYWDEDNMHQGCDIGFWWQLCWDWAGPKVGKLLSINYLMAVQENGEKIYAYMEICEAIELRPDNKWKVKSLDSGRTYILPRSNIWFPVTFGDGHRYDDRIRKEIAEVKEKEENDES